MITSACIIIHRPNDICTEVCLCGRRLISSRRTRKVGPFLAHAVGYAGLGEAGDEATAGALARCWRVVNGVAVAGGGGRCGGVLGVQGGKVAQRDGVVVAVVLWLFLEAAGGLGGIRYGGGGGEERRLVKRVRDVGAAMHHANI